MKDSVDALNLSCAHLRFTAADTLTLATGLAFLSSPLQDGPPEEVANRIEWILRNPSLGQSLHDLYNKHLLARHKRRQMSLSQQSTKDG